MARKSSTGSSIVYSTDKDFRSEEDQQNDIEIPPAEQKLTLKLDTKHRGGKAVTVVDGFIGKGLEETGRKLKVFCGTGGSVKDGQIIVQGDNREKIMQWLLKNGFKHVRKG